MKLSEALDSLRRVPQDAQSFPVHLCCGFTPLHLQTFLAAHLQLVLPGRKVAVETGLYDDLPGTLQSFAQEEGRQGVLFLEWSDLDPRLGFRSAGGWGPRVSMQVVDAVRSRLATLRKRIEGIPSTSRLVLSTPTLPLAPAFHTPPAHASTFELELKALVWEFARDAARSPSVRVLSSQVIDRESPAAERLDLRADLNTGFPFSNGHADVMGRLATRLLIDTAPKKGLITDLDDTLWFGLVGEIGHEAVCWDLSSHSQIHALYQQSLQSLADAGVLVAVASKNTPEIAQKALERSDMLLRKDSIFPFEIHWEPKSTSVSRILKAWNIGADAVVFVDDNQLELEEVRAAFPQIHTIHFPKNDARKFGETLIELRELFGKPSVTEEDALRSASLRQAQALSAEMEGEGGDSEAVLQNLEATVTFHLAPSGSDTRVLELVNKTNQFNLNGARYQPSEWQDLINRPEAFVWLMEYQDKFGPLGKIGVIQGQRQNGQLHVENWVMSCRAFSRRIEHQTLAQLFERFQPDTIRFQFVQTAKNAPTAEFLKEVGESLTAEDFQSACPPLYHQVEIKS